jgi:hypothetical protein
VPQRTQSRIERVDSPVGTAGSEQCAHHSGILLFAQSQFCPSMPDSIGWGTSFYLGTVAIPRIFGSVEDGAHLVQRVSRQRSPPDHHSWSTAG